MYTENPLGQRSQGIIFDTIIKKHNIIIEKHNNT